MKRYLALLVILLNANTAYAASSASNTPSIVLPCEAFSKKAGTLYEYSEGTLQKCVINRESSIVRITNPSKERADAACAYKLANNKIEIVNTRGFYSDIEKFNQQLMVGKKYRICSFDKQEIKGTSRSYSYTDYLDSITPVKAP